MGTLSSYHKIEKLMTNLIFMFNPLNEASIFKLLVDNFNCNFEHSDSVFAAHSLTSVSSDSISSRSWVQQSPPTVGGYLLSTCSV